jgi:hypothetical protein
MRRLSNRPAPAGQHGIAARRRQEEKNGMVSRGEILMLGIASGVSGGLIGGIMLGIGMNLIVNQANIGWLLLLPAAPASAIVGWLMGRRLAAQLDEERTRPNWGTTDGEYR